MARVNEARPFDLAPIKRWRRFVPSWLRDLMWVDSAPSYDAFLSYSWKSDREVAPVIQSVIHRFLCPWYKVRAKTVFRDLSCLPAGNSLQTELFARLDQSKHLIVLASPEAACSTGMEMEALHWFSGPSNKQILIIVTAGEGNSWDAIKNQLLPPSIRTHLPTKPLWVPLQHRRAEILADPTNAALHDQLIEDLKPVFLRLYPGVTWEELRGAERTQRRRALGLIASSALLFLILAAASFGFLWYAQIQKSLAQQHQGEAAKAQGEAEEQRRQAEAEAQEASRQANNADERRREAARQREIAVARQLAASSQALQQNSPSLLERSLLLSAEAMSRMRTAEVDEALRDALNVLPKQIARLTGKRMRVLGLTSDSRVLAASADGTTVQVWDLTTRKELVQLTHLANVTSLAFSHDASQMALLTNDCGPWCNRRAVSLWQIPTGRQLGQFDVGAAAWQVSFSPDGKYLAALANSGSALWKIPSGERAIPLGDFVTIVKFSSDGHYFATITDSGTRWGNDHLVNVRETVSGRLVLRVQTGEAANPARVVEFDADAKLIAAGCDDGTVIVWEVSSGKEVTRVRHEDRIGAISFGFNGEIAAAPYDPDKYMPWTGSPPRVTTRDRQVRVWALYDGEQRLAITHQAPVTSVDFTLDGHLLVTSSNDKLVRVWDVDTGAEVARLVHDSKVVSIIISPDAKQVATLTVGGIATVWELPVRASAFGRGLGDHIVFSPDEKYFATANTTSVWLFNSNGGRELAYLPTVGQLGPGGYDDGREIQQLGVTSDSKYFAARTGGESIRVWEAKTGRNVTHSSLRNLMWTDSFSFGPSVTEINVPGIKERRIQIWSVTRWRPGSQDGLSSELYLAVSSDRRYVAASVQETARVHQLIEGYAVADVECSKSLNGLVFSPSSRSVAAICDDRTVRLFDVKSGGETARLVSDFPIDSVAVTPDDLYLAISARHVVRVWRLPGEEACRIHYRGLLTDFVDQFRLKLVVAFSPQGRYLLTNDGDAVRVWEWRLEDLMGEACSRLTRNLTANEWHEYIGDEPRHKTCLNLP